MASDRLAFIIGASRGIGYATALRLAQDGFDVAATCRGDTARLDGLRAQIEALGHSFLPVLLDVTDRAESIRVITELFADKPPFAVVYNAGISRDDLFAWMTSAEWDDVIRTGLDGFYNCVQPLVQ
ncbi:MAG: SDR family NAD(P)-dependent oxidoreductase, partial [Lentisphaeria bacterium]|nr:SDR family NAD(P)-dependent oxidoreductase [Lentisphaeria bacterium]